MVFFAGFPQLFQVFGFNTLRCVAGGFRVDKAAYGLPVAAPCRRRSHAVENHQAGAPQPVEFGPNPQETVPGNVVSITYAPTAFWPVICIVGHHDGSTISQRCLFKIYSFKICFVLGYRPACCDGYRSGPDGSRPAATPMAQGCRSHGGTGAAEFAGAEFSFGRPWGSWTGTTAAAELQR